MLSIPTFLLTCVTLFTPINGFPSAPLRVSYTRSSHICRPLTSPTRLNKRDTTEVEIWSGSCQNYSAYLRFSPLVGGPTFLPIHVEVILHSSSPPNPPTTGSGKESDADTSTEDGADGTIKARAAEYVHRIDFLPENPSDPRTLFRLLTLRSVPALIRHRVLVTHLSTTARTQPVDPNECVMVPFDNISIQRVSKSRIDSLIGAKQEVPSGSSRVFILPLGSIWLSNDGDAVTQDIPKLPNSIETYLQRQAGVELNLLTNNCYSFAWGVLKSSSANFLRT